MIYGKKIDMGIERTFSIIKPDATLANKTGAINALIEQSGLRIIAQRRIRMTKATAVLRGSFRKTLLR